MPPATATPTSSPSTSRHIRTRTREHIANHFLNWIRNDTTQDAVGGNTQREIRDELLRLVNLPSRTESLRIANELTRWIFSGSEDLRDLRWREDMECRRRILRTINAALEKEGAELDDDISDDLTAASYPRCFERIQTTLWNAKQFLREQQSLGKPIREAEGGLVTMLREGLQEWETLI